MFVAMSVSLSLHLLKQPQSHKGPGHHLRASLPNCELLWYPIHIPTSLEELRGPMAVVRAVIIIILA